MDYLLIGMRTERSTLQGWKKDGKWTEWKVNGQKWKEVHYKDGELISEKCWDKYGIEKECD